jgi:hypothetical protein
MELSFAVSGGLSMRAQAMFGLAVRGHEAAIHRQRDAVDEARVVAGEEGHHGRDLRRVGAAAQRNALAELGHELAVALHVRGHRREGEARAHGVHPHAVAAVVERQRLGEVHDRALRGVVETHAPVAAEARHRPGVDDAALALDQVRHGGAAAVEHAADVGGHDLVPAIEWRLGDGALDRDARVVEQHMQRAEALDGGRHQRLHLLVVRHVGHLDQRALGRQVARHLVELGLGVAGEHHARAFLREAAGGGLADARAGARDDDDLVGETLHVNLLVRRHRMHRMVRRLSRQVFTARLACSCGTSAFALV